MLFLLGKTPLHIAVQENNTDTVQLLIDNNVSINSQTKAGKHAVQFLILSLGPNLDF